MIQRKTAVPRSFKLRLDAGQSQLRLITTILKTLTAFPAVFKAVTAVATILKALTAFLALTAYEALAVSAAEGLRAITPTDQLGITWVKGQW